MEKKGRVLIIDDDPLVVESLKIIVESGGFEVLATGSSGKDAIELSKKYNADVILMDIRMHPINGMEATREILKDKKEAKILLITTFKDDEYIEGALKLGCRGYILKQNIKGIIPAVIAVSLGQMVFDSIIADRLGAKNKPLDDAKDRELGKILGERELDILKLIAEGLNNKEISQKLFLSEGTIRNYISDMLLKLNLRDRTQLAIYYLKFGEN